jgi:cytochrome b6-f complex iron-sulfur subunit
MVSMADEETTQEPAEKASPAVRAAGAVSASGGHAVVVAQPAAVGPVLPIPQVQVTRRGVLRTAFWGGIGVTLLGIVGTIINSLYPRGVQKFGGQFVLDVNANELLPGDKRDIVVLIPNPTAPLENLEAKVYLVRFSEEQASRNPGAEAGSILALYRKCPHLGCTVPYNDAFTREDPLNGETYSGWFLCPCHGSTYSDAGRRVFGPAPRSMDVFPLTIAPDGTMTIDLDQQISGSENNASHATPFGQA